MKKLIPVLLTVVLLPTACIKSKPDEKKYTMQVFESNTNTPIPDVRIDMYYCARSEWGTGCVSIGLLATGYTDNNGRYEFQANNFKNANEGIKLTKDKYWEAKGGEGIQYMVPEGWLDLRLVRKNTYPDKSYFSFEIYGEPSYGGIFQVKAPVDSVVKIRGFGNQINKINWTFSDCQHYPCDILASGVITKSLGKFTSTPVTLEY